MEFVQSLWKNRDIRDGGRPKCANGVPKTVFSPGSVLSIIGATTTRQASDLGVIFLVHSRRYAATATLPAGLIATQEGLDAEPACEPSCEPLANRRQIPHGQKTHQPGFLLSMLARATSRAARAA